MARATGKDHARINLDIWGDDDWLDLTPPAQHLYFVLWTSPQLSYCGTGDWHPGKIAAKAKGWTPTDVDIAAAELSAELFLVIDTDTDEFILRSWMKHDGLWRTPNMAVSMAMARAELASRSLRGVVVHEVAKIKARDPKSSSWDRDAVVKMLSQTAVDPASLPRYNPACNPPPNGGGNPDRNSAAKGYTRNGSNPTANPGPTPAPSPAPTSTLQGGYVTGERHLRVAPDPTDPPPRRCAEHRNEPSTKGCGACADARRARDDWDIAQAAARAQAITDCTLCDPAGWLLVPGTNVPVDPATKCTHDTRAAANA